MPTFHIVNDPWLDVLYSDGETKTVSLGKLLSDLHQIERISESSPLTEVALLRFLIALLSDGLRELVPTEDAWLPFVERCQSGLPAQAIDAILEPLMASPDVLAADHSGFFDGPSITNARSVHAIYPPRDVPASVTDVLLSVPTDTEISHFRRVEAVPAVCVRCLLKGVLAKSLFATGGGGGYSSGAAGAKPAFAVLVGSTLLQTLLLNFVVADFDDIPGWRRQFSRSLGRHPKVIERLTWKARLYSPRRFATAGTKCCGCGGSGLASVTELDRADGFKNTPWADGFLAGELLGKEEDDSDPLLHDPHLIEQTGESSRRVLTDAPNAGLKAHLNRINAEAVLASHGAARGAFRMAIIPLVRIARSSLPHDTYRICLFASLGDPTKMNIEQVRHAEIRVVSHLEPDGSATFLTDSPDSVSNSNNPPIESDEPSDGDCTIAARIILRLEQLPRHKLQALKPRSRGGAVDRAVRQAAFEQVWHRLAFPGASKRHSMREALATVAGLFAVHADRCRFQTVRGSFATLLKSHVLRERSRSDSRHDVGSVERIVKKLMTASPFARDELLLRLVDELAVGALNGSSRSINFADLLVDVVLWNDPRDPTPTRWDRLLKDAAGIAAKQ